MAKMSIDVSDAEMVVFRKKLKTLAQFTGRGTELISVYIPPKADRSNVIGQLTEETAQSANIKSPQTRKNVQGALRKIQNFLKQINFKIPPKGLVVFAGNVSEQDGKSDIQLFTVKPPMELKTKLYWCDSQFHLTPLEEMAAPTEYYGLACIDKNEATIALLSGKKYEILGKFTSNVPGKFRAGGQSAQRFERLREEAAQDFYKRVSEKINDAFQQYGEKIGGLVIGGPGMTKNYFLERELIDYRLREKILGTIDTSYTDESGIQELVQNSETLLKDTELMKERTMVNKFLEAVARNGLAVFGHKEVIQALELGKVDTVLVSEGITWRVLKALNTDDNTEHEELITNPTKFDAGRFAVEFPRLEIIEDIDYLDWIMEKAPQTGASVQVISRDTSEGQQFYNGFDGIGAILRYK